MRCGPVQADNDLTIYLQQLEEDGFVVAHAAVDSACVFEGHVAESKAGAAFCVRATNVAVGTRVAVGGLGGRGFSSL
jgi:hypothetical protein